MAVSSPRTEQQDPTDESGLSRLAAWPVGVAFVLLAPAYWWISVIWSEEGWDTNVPLRVLGSVLALVILGAGGLAFVYAASGGYRRAFWAVISLAAILFVAWLVAHDSCANCAVP